MSRLLRSITVDAIAGAIAVVVAHALGVNLRALVEYLAADEDEEPELPEPRELHPLAIPGAQGRGRRAA